MKPQAPAQAAATQPGTGAIDVEAIITKAEAGIPANLKDIFDKAVLSGMRIMFDKNSHQMAMKELDKPGPMATRLSNGIIALVYLLWEQSNKTLPPQILVPVTLVLTLRAFQFLQMSHDPEATKEVMGEAVAEAVQGVMDRAGATIDKVPGLLKQQQGGAAPAPAAPAAPAGGGMLDAAAGA